jgi:hypothetical protein
MNRQLFFYLLKFIMLTIKVNSELDILASERRTTFTFLCLTHLSLLRTDQAERGQQLSSPSAPAALKAECSTDIALSKKCSKERVCGGNV